MNRRDFLRGIFRPTIQTEGMVNADSTDYRSLLPPEFSSSMLKMEAERLGGDTEHMSENDMAALVYRALNGEGVQS